MWIKQIQLVKCELQLASIALLHNCITASVSLMLCRILVSFEQNLTIKEVFVQLMQWLAINCCSYTLRMCFFAVNLHHRVWRDSRCQPYIDPQLTLFKISQYCEPSSSEWWSVKVRSFRFHFKSFCSSTSRGFCKTLVYDSRHMRPKKRDRGREERTGLGELKRSPTRDINTNNHFSL